MRSWKVSRPRRLVFSICIIHFFLSHGAAAQGTNTSKYYGNVTFLFISASLQLRVAQGSVDCGTPLNSDLCVSQTIDVSDCCYTKVTDVIDISSDSTNVILSTRVTVASLPPEISFGDHSSPPTAATNVVTIGVRSYHNPNEFSQVSTGPYYQTLGSRMTTKYDTLFKCSTQPHHKYGSKNRDTATQLNKGQTSLYHCIQ